MADESVDFELKLQDAMSAQAKKMASEMKRLEEQILKVNRATVATERTFARAVMFPAGDWNRHNSYLERSRKNYRALAPASAAAARGLRSFGVSGSWIRKFSVDTAKAETALRRLYRVKGGGAGGAAAVAGSLARRGVARYGGSVARGAGNMAMSAAGGAASVAAGGAAMAGGAALIGSGMLAVEMTKTAIEADRVRFALDRVTNGDGQKWWSLSADYAKRFGLNVNSVADNLMNMQASGFSEDMTKTLFLRMGDLRALGATEETIGRALLAIRQVQAAGRLQGDELNQLSEAGINANFVYAELSKTLGKTIPEIIKMKEAGELTSAIVIPAIANAIGAKTGGGAAGAAGEAAATQTVSGQWGRMTGAFSVASTNALGSDAMAPLRLAISNFTDWISGPGGSAAIGGFGKMLTGLFEQAPVVIEKVIWLFDEGLPAAWKGFSAGFEEAGGSAVFGALSNGLSNLAGDNGEQARSSLASLGQTMGSLAGSLATLVGWLVQATSALTSLVDVGSVFSSTVAPITGIFKGFNGAGDASIGDALRQTPIFQGLSGAFSGIGLDMANGLASGLSAGNPAVQAAASQLATAAEMAARDTSETHSPSKAFERVGMDQGDGNAQGLIKSIPQIQSASTAMTNGSLSSAKDASTAGGSGGPVTVQISIDRGQGDGRSDGDLLELAADIFERRMTQLFGRLAYSGAR